MADMNSAEMPTATTPVAPRADRMAELLREIGIVGVEWFIDRKVRPLLAAFEEETGLRCLDWRLVPTGASFRTDIRFYFSPTSVKRSERVIRQARVDFYPVTDAD